MTGDFSGIQAELRAPLARAEPPDSGLQSAAKTATSFAMPSYQRAGLIELEASGEAFWLDADFEGSSVVQSGSVDLSGVDRVDLTYVSEEDMKIQWCQHVLPNVIRYLKLAGTP